MASSRRRRVRCADRHVAALERTDTALGPGDVDVRDSERRHVPTGAVAIRESAGLLAAPGAVVSCGRKRRQERRVGCDDGARARHGGAECNP